MHMCTLRAAAFFFCFFELGKCIGPRASPSECEYRSKYMRYVYMYVVVGKPRRGSATLILYSNHDGIPLSLTYRLLPAPLNCPHSIVQIIL